MELDELKLALQGHFSDGLVLVVGSGLSCAEGLPGMGALADRLVTEIPPMLEPEDVSSWAELEPLIHSKGLEPALFSVSVSGRLQAQIAQVVGDYVAAKESEVILDVFRGGRTLRLSRLIPHLLKTQPAIPVITTNYDRLVEVAFEDAGMGIDSMFVGEFAGALNEKEAGLSLIREVRLLPNKQVRRSYRSHVRLAKPHGSLDWYLRSGKPVRCALELPGLPRLVIAPGQRKFRAGYESPFDQQRERANRAIDGACRFMIIGYGFNDDHLETHLTPAIQAGKPALLLTRDLTPTAEAIARANPDVIAIDRRDVDERSRVFWRGISHTFDVNMWDLGSFVLEVFKS